MLQFNLSVSNHHCVAMPKLSDQTKEQKVRAFRKRMSTSIDGESGTSSKRAANLLGGGQDLTTDESESDFSEDEQFTQDFPNSRLNDYMKALHRIAYNENTRNSFFKDKETVVKFGYTMTHRMRVGFDKHCQGYKLDIRKETLADLPTVASINMTELAEILDYIKDTLKQIDESVAKGAPLFHYGPKVLRNPRKAEFWDHEDEYLSSSTLARMCFVHIQNDRYQFHINSPIVLDSVRFKDYMGPILTWCRTDVDQFLVAVDGILKKMDPAEL